VFPLLFLFELLLFVVVTPEVFLLPLLFVTTAVFDGAVLPFMFLGMFAFVSTTPFLVAVLALLVFVPLELVFDVLALSPPQADRAQLKLSAANRTLIFCIFLLLKRNL
jgi:hypothetical protein